MSYENKKADGQGDKRHAGCHFGFGTVCMRRQEGAAGTEAGQFPGKTVCVQRAKAGFGHYSG